MRILLKKLVKCVLSLLFLAAGIALPFVPGVIMFSIMEPVTFWEKLAGMVVVLFSAFPTIIGGLALIGVAANIFCSETK